MSATSTTPTLTAPDEDLTIEFTTIGNLFDEINRAPPRDTLTVTGYDVFHIFSLATYYY